MQSTEEVVPKNRWGCLEGLTKRWGDTCLSQKRYMRFRGRKEKREDSREEKRRAGEGRGGERGKKEKKEEGNKEGRSVLGRAGATSWEH